MSAPTNYGDLKVSLRDYLGITSGSAYANHVDLFIDLAESRFNAELRTRNQLTTATLSLDANGEAALPADYVGFKRAVADEGSVNIDLRECSPELLSELYPITYSGIARHITVDGSTVRVRPLTSSDIAFTYYAKITPLDDANTTNWLLTKMPGLYLAAALYEGSLVFGGEIGNSERYFAMMQDQMALLKSSDSSERIRSRALRVKGATP